MCKLYTVILNFHSNFLPLSNVIVICIYIILISYVLFVIYLLNNSVYFSCLYKYSWSIQEIKIKIVLIIMIIIVLNIFWCTNFGHDEKRSQNKIIGNLSETTANPSVFFINLFTLSA